MSLPSTDPAVNPDILTFAPHNAGTTWVAFLTALVAAAGVAQSTAVSAAYNPERDRLYQLISELDRVLTNASISV